MIGFFIKAGDVEVDAEFTPYIWGDHGFGDSLDRLLKRRSYSRDGKIILIMLYVEGSLLLWPPNWMPKKLRASYSNKDKALSVRVPVLKEFFAKNEKERCSFIVESVLASLNAVRSICERRQLDLDLDSLVRDVEKKGKQWIAKRQSK